MSGITSDGVLHGAFLYIENETKTKFVHRYVYIFCEKAEKNAKGGWDYEVKPYKPADFLLQDIAQRLSNAKPLWDAFVTEGKNSIIINSNFLIRAKEQIDVLIVSAPPMNTLRYYDVIQ